MLVWLSIPHLRGSVYVGAGVGVHNGLWEVGIGHFGFWLVVETGDSIMLLHRGFMRMHLQYNGPDHKRILKSLWIRPISNVCVIITQSTSVTRKHQWDTPKIFHRHQISSRSSVH